MSGLLLPLGILTQHFGNQSNYLEYAYWHVGVQTCAFSQYYGSSYAQHYHAGTDWSDGLGTPVYAMEAGVVQYEGWAPNPGTFAGGGIIVDVKIYGGMYYTFCHLNSAAVSRGQSVKRGQLLGYEGATGVATGPHKHTACRTVNSYGVSLFHNPEQYVTGGVYAGSSLIRPAPAPSPTGTFKVTVGPGTVTGFHIARYTRAITGSKSGYWARASGAGTATSTLPGYYLIQAGYYEGYYLISGKSGPFTLTRI